MKAPTSELYKTLQEQIPQVSEDLLGEILDIIKVVEKNKRKKKKFEELTLEEKILLGKKKALNYINHNFRKYILMEEGVGYYLIAHSKTIKVRIEHVKSVFQPVEQCEDKEYCCITIIKYHNINKKEINQFLQMNCDVISIN